MHSSRMRTVCSSGHLSGREGDLPSGVCLGECLPGRECLPSFSENDFQWQKIFGMSMSFTTQPT